MTVWCPDSRSVESNCGEVRQTGAEERPEGFGGSTAGGAHEGFELREAEFNGIEVHERGADALSPGGRRPLCVRSMTMSPGCRVGTRICSI